jgi:hypothetical protein
MWELAAYADGLNRVNGKIEPPTDEEFDNMLLRHGIN